MLPKYIISKQANLKAIGKIVALISLCGITILFFYMFSALIITKIDFSYKLLIPLTTVILALSAFIDSLIVAKYLKQNGFIIGTIISSIFFIFVIITAVLSGELAITQLFLTKFIAILASGILGGVIGVNIT